MIALWLDAARYVARPRAVPACSRTAGRGAGPPLGGAGTSLVLGNLLLAAMLTAIAPYGSREFLAKPWFYGGLSAAATGLLIGTISAVWFRDARPQMQEYERQHP
jgi:hypothetical protein